MKRSKSSDVLLRKNKAAPNPQTVIPDMSRYMLCEMAHSREPIVLSRNAATTSALLPTLFATRPEGSSMKTRKKKNADVTRPTKIPVGSNPYAIMGRKALVSPIPITREKPVMSNWK